ncbi:MAG TPA: TetR/AcrR family transcriptional regulator [Stellaceae bacterium]|jgi:TetR/AcrR family transcriptional repressor of nem operon|nr:TetR/AcrR family transcriptional regulator [Stellaceae bacterium]
MGHSQADKALTHQRIVEIAARRFREKGLDGIGVADLMKEAGLTVGGFYKHFASRDALVAEAVAAARSAWYDDAKAAEEGGPPLELDKMIDGYLSTAHRDAEGTGCVFSALAPDIARNGEATRAAALEQWAFNVGLIATLMASGDDADRRSRAILASCAMVGAVALARVARGTPQSQEILDTVKERLKELC